mmetsp:Transcript_2313/g.6685  ORF Transcript_2313/g.6685 Transcript_2313/m.6685 type:complete len:86 (+) Transcript_2313:244-501(+)
MTTHHELTKSLTTKSLTQGDSLTTVLLGSLVPTQRLQPPPHQNTMCRNFPRRKPPRQRALNCLARACSYKVWDKSWALRSRVEES